MKYSKIIITNLPSFYKVNLFNRINEKEKIFVVFTGNTAEVRNNDFLKTEQIKFDFVELRNKNQLQRTMYLFSLLVSTRYDELALGGWDEFLLWFAAFFSPKRKNALIIESSYFESVTTGVKGIIKKLYLTRITKVYASGENQKKIVDNLNYQGKVIITKGVGVFNFIPQPSYAARSGINDFLYVGRLSPEKNIPLLIRYFNQNPNLTLHIVGFGPIEIDLKNMSNENIKYYGAIDNTQLKHFYQKYDVFILPSKSEPWGLVVEEALNNGMPVIVSNRVGCQNEVVTESNGLVFESDNYESLDQAITLMRNVEFYNNLRRNISLMSFEDIVNYQVESYLS